jgi:hydroxymethylbilane synthase
VGASEKIVLGSRGSDLALAQAKMVERALRNAWPDLEIATEIIRTSGDESSPGAPVVDRKAGRKGMFTREIEKQLIVRRIDLAVHSAKDLPSEAMDELEICGALPRGPVGDVLITRDNFSLTSLPAGAVVATGSVRRQRQLRWKRPDLETADLRGNVPTRLRKLRETEIWSGIILARAGLERLGFEIVGRALRLPQIEMNAKMELGQPKRSPYNGMPIDILSHEDFVPAGGQGVIALQVRRDDERVQQLVAPINHEPTRLCLRAEREFLRLLNGDCDSPVGVQASIAEEKLRLHAQVFEAEISAPRAGTLSGPIAQPEALAVRLMEKLYGSW